jgi:hypothetical protein
VKEYVHRGVPAAAAAAAAASAAIIAERGGGCVVLLSVVVAAVALVEPAEVSSEGREEHLLMVGAIQEEVRAARPVEARASAIIMTVVEHRDAIPWVVVPVIVNAMAAGKEERRQGAEDQPPRSGDHNHTAVRLYSGNIIARKRFYFEVVRSYQFPHHPHHTHNIG